MTKEDEKAGFDATFQFAGELVDLVMKNRNPNISPLAAITMAAGEIAAYEEDLPAALASLAENYICVREILEEEIDEEEHVCDDCAEVQDIKKVPIN